ncbi:MAG: Sir2 family NAD-dependent protein deacetylase, partial [Nitrospinota bacterium]
MDDKLEIVAKEISSAKHVTVLTGAGVSAESGIPTFRGKDGLWNNFNAEELATPEAFNKDPLLVWRWYDYRRNIIASANPNDGHIA